MEHSIQAERKANVGESEQIQKAKKNGTGDCLANAKEQITALWGMVKNEGKAGWYERQTEDSYYWEEVAELA